MPFVIFLRFVTPYLALGVEQAFRLQKPSPANVPEILARHTMNEPELGSMAYISIMVRI